MDPEAVVIEGGGGLYIRFAGHRDGGPHVVRTIGLWATGRRLKLSLHHMLALPRDCKRHSRYPTPEGNFLDIKKIWVLICPDATALWHTSVTKPPPRTRTRSQNKNTHACSYYLVKNKNTQPRGPRVPISAPIGPCWHAWDF